MSAPVTISLGDRLWSVENYEGSNLGTIDLETATTYSDNTVYAQLTELIRPQAVAQMARRLGIQSPIKGYFSVTLGGEAVNPLEMARAFATVANGGQRIDGALMGNRPRAVLTCKGCPGGGKNIPVPREALGANEAAIVTRLLQGVVESGTGKRAQLSDGRPVAGKTGTTENYGDAWFVGYTPQLAVAVWVGYPDLLRPMLDEYHGSPVAGGTFPAQIFKTFMEKALPRLGAEPESFPSPSYPYASPRSIVFRDGRWRADNGYCRGTREILYFYGTGPDTTADCKPNEVDVPRVVGLTYDDAVARLGLQPLDAEADLQAGRAAPARRVRARPAAAGRRAALRLRHGAARRRQAAARRRPSRGRSRAGQGAERGLAQRELRPVVRRAAGERPPRPRPLAATASRCRGGAAHARHAGCLGAGRLRKREPAST